MEWIPARIWIERLLAPDVALLPINGDHPERRVAGNLNGREAATLAKNIGARLVIPCHYDLFEFNTASPEEFIATARALAQPYRVLRGGERWSAGRPAEAALDIRTINGVPE